MCVISDFKSSFLRNMHEPWTMVIVIILSSTINKFYKIIYHWNRLLYTYGFERRRGVINNIIKINK